jgi:1-acyl-sn-glycerol-3-phosphate acyltransferase
MTKKKPTGADAQSAKTVAEPSAAKTGGESPPRKPSGVGASRARPVRPKRTSRARHEAREPAAAEDTRAVLGAEAKTKIDGATFEPSPPSAGERKPPSMDAPTQPVVEGVPSDIDVGAQIRALEERLDKMIGEAQRRGAETEPAPRSTRTGRSSLATPSEGSDSTVFDTARELLSTDFYMRKWGRLGMRNRSEEVDDFGKDPVYEERVMPLFTFLYEHYFRVECEGIGNIPDEGRCLLVANHSGTIPLDGAMLKIAVAKEHKKHRDVRWLAEDLIFHFPFLGSFTNRVGAVRACQENAERLLSQEALVAVFPEGIKGIGKLWKERYRLQRFGRGGFIKLCLRTGTPIVPVAIVGAEETHPMLGRLQTLARTIGLPYIPVTPTFPLLGPLGLLPLPAKWKIVIGSPLRLEGYGAEAEGDEILVGRLSEQVRGTIQGMLDRAVGARQSVWFG